MAVPEKSPAKVSLSREAVPAALIVPVPVAGAPVTHWKFYDTIYTERYMGTPKENAKGYETSAPLSKAKDVRAKLLLIHGTADALTPFEQSRNMCRAIRNVGAQCDLLAVKGGGHGLRRWESAGLTSYKRLMIGWLEKRLAPGA